MGLLLTVAEVETLRVSNMTVYRLIKSGELTAIRVGEHRIRQVDLDDYLSGGFVDVQSQKG